MSDRTAFEKGIRESLEGYRAPYDPEPWEGIEQALDRMEAPGNKGTSKGNGPGKWASWAGGVAALGAVAAGIFFFGQDKEEERAGDPTGEEKELVEERADAPDRERLEKERPESSAEEEAGSSIDPELKEKREESDEEKNAKAGKVRNEDKGSPSRTGNEKTDASAQEGTLENAPPKDRGEERSEASGSDGQGPPPTPKEELPVSFRILASSEEGCPPFKVAFQSPGAPESVDYFWEFGDGSYSNKPDPVHLYDEAGTYDVSLTLTDRKSGATVKREKEAFVEVHPEPEARIVEVEDERLKNRAEPRAAFRIEDRENVRNISWKVGEGSKIERGPKVEHRFNKGAHEIRAYLRSAEGCTDTIRYSYEQKKSYNLLAPNAFEPNGNGRNDVFIPEALKVLDVPFTMTIHEPRTGRVVYKTTNTGRPWDGRVNNSGRAVESGSVFLWVVVLENENGEEETYKGNVTVIK